jgi:hypothetical protein
MWWKTLLSKRLAAAMCSVMAITQSGSDAWGMVTGIAAIAAAYIAGESYRPSGE